MSPVFPACRKRWFNGAVSQNNRIKIKGWPRVGAWTSALKNLTKCLWRLEPDRRSNFYFSPPAHLCAVTCMTEISLIVTLINQFTFSPSPAAGHPTPWQVGVLSVPSLPRHGNRDVRGRLLPPCYQRAYTRWGLAGNRNRIIWCTFPARYLYATAASHINHRHICFNIKSIPVHTLLWMNVMLDFICMVFAEMWTTFR